MFLLPAEFFKIKQTALKGKGVFAANEIPEGTVIGDYIGRVIRTSVENTSEDKGLYLMYYHDQASIYPLDIKVPGIHLLNHSCSPNCWIYVYRGHTLVFSLRKIKPGEELTISYQFSPNRFCQPCTHVCKCGIQNCTGSMHLSEEKYIAWSQFNKQQSAKTKRQRVRYGKILPKLSDYPKTIANISKIKLYHCQEIILQEVGGGILRRRWWGLIRELHLVLTI